MKDSVCLYVGEGLARYGFGRGHPFGVDRLAAFRQAARQRGLEARARLCPPVTATDEVLTRFHTPGYVSRVKALSESGREGFLDAGDTPYFPGVFEAAATVVGSAVDAAARILSGECRRAFLPIGGLHHARRDGASGFCVFNDCGVVIETLRRVHGLRRIAYVDLDAHHGDGVFYAFEDDPDVWVADVHESGRFLFPGTGEPHETGRGRAAGTKINVALPPGATDADLLRIWPELEDFLRRGRPEFLLFQGGADSLAGDPLAHLSFTAGAHAHVTRRLVALAEELGHGRLLALGGGGYDPLNLTDAWTAVLEVLVDAG